MTAWLWWWWWWCYNCNKSGHALRGCRRSGSLEYNIHGGGGNFQSANFPCDCGGRFCHLHCRWLPSCSFCRKGRRPGWLHHNEMNLWIIINPSVPLASHYNLYARAATALTYEFLRSQHHAAVIKHVNITLLLCTICIHIHTRIRILFGRVCSTCGIYHCVCVCVRACN